VENAVARGALADDELLLPKDSNNSRCPWTSSFLSAAKSATKFSALLATVAGRRQWHGGRARHEAAAQLHQDRLRQAANGYFYDNITNGFGQMLGYSAQIPPRDRWAIIAYIRALQLSGNAKAADLPAELRESSIKVQLRPPNRAGRTIREEAASDGCAGLSGAGKRSRFSSGVFRRWHRSAPLHFWRPARPRTFLSVLLDEFSLILGLTVARWAS